MDGHLARFSLMKRRRVGGVNSRIAPLDDRSAWKWIPKRSSRRKLAGVLSGAVLLLIGLCIVANEWDFRQGFAFNGADVHYWSPDRVRQRGLAFEGPLDPWDFYSVLMQSEVPRNATYEAEGIAHASSGVSCDNCYIDPHVHSSSEPPWITLPYALLWLQTKLRFLDFLKIKERKGKPCYGCLHELTSIGGISEKSTAAAEMFFASGPNVATGKAAVKIHCLNKEDFLVGKTCSRDFIVNVENERAVAKVATECGLDELLTHVWMGPVDGISNTEHLRTMGVWSNAAEGFSVRSIWAQSTRKDAFELIRGVNSTQVLMAAMLDALTRQYNRNPDNAYISESGKLTLINNEKILLPLECLRDTQAFNFKNPPCQTSLDSLFIPGPGHGQGANLLVWDRWTDRGSTTIRRSPRKENTVLWLDYRCHAPNGTIGFDFPPEMAKCLTRFSNMTDSQLHRDIFSGGVGVNAAKVLIDRSKDLLRLGFEGAIKKWYGEELKFDDWGKPCCQMELVEDSIEYTCG